MFVIPGCLVIATVVGGLARSVASPPAVVEAQAETSEPGRAPGRSLTPDRSVLRSFPPTPALEAAARGVPRDQRTPTPDGHWILLGNHEVLGSANSTSWPVFTSEDELAGIYVPGLGVVDRATYDDPDVDLEALAEEKWGAEESARRRAMTEADLEAR